MSKKKPLKPSDRVYLKLSQEDLKKMVEIERQVDQKIKARQAREAREISTSS